MTTSLKRLFLATTSYLRECLGRASEPRPKSPGTHCPRSSGSQSSGPVYHDKRHSVLQGVTPKRGVFGAGGV